MKAAKTARWGSELTRRLGSFSGGAWQGSSPLLDVGVGVTPGNARVLGTLA